MFEKSKENTTREIKKITKKTQKKHVFPYPFIRFTIKKKLKKIFKNFLLNKCPSPTRAPVPFGENPKTQTDPNERGAAEINQNRGWQFLIEDSRREAKERESQS